MTKPLGKLFKLYYEDPANAGQYLLLANCRSNGLDVATEAIDVTDKDGMPDRELIEGGVRTRDVTASGVMSDAASIKLMEQWADAGSIKNFQTRNSLKTVTGPFQVASFSEAGDHDGEQTWDMKLASAGAAIVVYL